MQRNALTGDQEIEVIQEEEEEASAALDEDGNPIEGANGKKKQAQKIRFKDSQGQRTLEQEKHITLTSFDTQHEVDPLFRKTTQKFDEMRIGNLMSSTLSVTHNLLLQLDSQMTYTSNLMDEETNKR